MWQGPYSIGVTIEAEQQKSEMLHLFMCKESFGQFLGAVVVL